MLTLRVHVRLHVEFLSSQRIFNFLHVLVPVRMDRDRGQVNKHVVVIVVREIEIPSGTLIE